MWPLTLSTPFWCFEAILARYVGRFACEIRFYGSYLSYIIYTYCSCSVSAALCTAPPHMAPRQVGKAAAHHHKSNDIEIHGRVVIRACTALCVKWSVTQYGSNENHRAKTLLEKHTTIKEEDHSHYGFNSGRTTSLHCGEIGSQERRAYPPRSTQGQNRGKQCDLIRTASRCSSPRS